MQKMDYGFLAGTLLFQGADEAEIEAMLRRLGSRVRSYDKGETIYRAGSTTRDIGLVLSGGVMIENDDVWGNKSILAHVEPGCIFAETYACIPDQPLMVNVSASEPSEILFISVRRLFSTCKNSCAHHERLIGNILMISAQKNLALSRRILHTSSKSIRGRLLSYLSERSRVSDSRCFTIPFNRQQLADYLSVERSAMSNELSKMQKDGVIKFHKNDFEIIGDIGGITHEQ